MRFNFVTHHPKLFWLMMCAPAVSLVLGVPAVLIVLFTKSQVLQLIVFRGFVFLWVTGAVLALFYFVRQVLGKYIGMNPKPIRDQIW